MKMSHVEIATINYAMTMTGDAKPRQFQFSDLGLISDISKKLMAHVKDGKIEAGDYDVELSTAEKSKILTLVKEMNWSAGDASAVLELVKKLE